MDKRIKWGAAAAVAAAGLVVLTKFARDDVQRAGESQSEHHEAIVAHSSRPSINERVRLPDSESGKHHESDYIDWDDETSPYRAYDNTTLEALAANGDAKAAEWLALKIYQQSPSAGRYHALAAAAMSEKPNALMTIVSHYLSHEGAEMDALPLVIVAERLGNDHAGIIIDIRREDGKYTSRDIEAAEREAAAMFSQMRKIRLERLGVDFEGRYSS